MSARFFNPLIHYYVNQKQKRALEDPELKYETSSDQTFMTQKIYGRNIIQIVRLILQLFVIVYFIGMYWFVFVDVIIHIMDPLDHLAFDSFLSKFEHIDTVGSEQVFTAMYFAMTSLSTIGFGDMYPVND